MASLTRERLTRVLHRLREREGRVGIVAGRASGVFVSLTVLAFFIQTGLFADNVVWAVLLSVPVVLSLLFTLLSTQHAVRAKSHRDARVVHLAGMVAPPFAIFLVTCYGAFFAGVAGLIAFLMTWPIVVATRRAHRAGHGLGREQLIGATALAAGALLLLSTELALLASTGGAHLPSVWPLAGPPAAAALSALCVAGPNLLRQAARLRIADLVQRGAVRDARATPALDGAVEFDQVHTLPGGPHRGAQIHMPLGRVVLAPAEVAWGGGIVFVSLAVLAGSIGFLLA